MEATAAGRQLAARIRAQREAAGLTQGQLALAVGYARQYVSRAEAANRGLPSAALVDALDRVLRCGGELMALRERAVAEQIARRTGGEPYVDQDAGPPAAIPLLGEPAAPPARITVDMIDVVRYRTVRLRRLDDYLGGADTYRLYAIELAATLDWARHSSYTDEVGSALAALIAEQEQQAGWSAFDAGWTALARRHFTSSVDAAVRAGNQALAANGMIHLSYQSITAGGSGVRDASAAGDTVGVRAAPRVRALIAERTAWAHACAGQVSEAEHALGTAADALSQAGDDDPDWTRWVDDIELQIMTGRCWTELRRPLRAVPALRDGLDRYRQSSGGNARDHALYSTWLAQALLDGGEVEQAAVVLTQALTTSAAVASVRPRQRVLEMLPRLAPHRTLQPVAELIDAAATDPVALSAVPSPDTPQTLP